MKRISKSFFILFCLILLVFFYRTAIFWLNSLYFVSDHDVVMYATQGLIYLMFAFLILGGHSLKTRSVHVICLCWFCMMLVVLQNSHTALSHYFKCLFWPILFEFTYLLVKDDKGRLNGLIKMYMVVAAFGLILFLYSLGIRQFGSASNIVYFFVLTTPVLLLNENKKWRYSILILATFIAMLSMKISMLLSMTLFWAIVGISYFWKSRYKSRILFASILVSVVFVFSYNLVNRLTNNYYQQRLEREDQTNGRDLIYEITWDMQKHSSNKEWLLGHGHNAVRMDSPMTISAHNEWLEILYDYGAICLLLYFFFWIYVIKRWLFHLRTKSQYFIPYTLSICIFLIMSLVSQLVLYVSYFLYLVMFWAIVEALSENSYYIYKHKVKTT